MRYRMIEALTLLVSIGASWQPCPAQGDVSPPVASPAERLQAIKDSQARALQAYQAGLQASDPDRRRGAVDAYLAAVAANSDLALELAETSPADSAAIGALVFVIRTAKAGPSDHSERAVALLSRDHAKDQGVGEACQSVFFLFDRVGAERFIRAVLKENPGRVERGSACLALGRLLAYRAKMIRWLRENPDRIDEFAAHRGKEGFAEFLNESDVSAMEAEAAGLLEQAASDYGDVKEDGRTLSEIAGGELFELRYLSVGKPAPEIEGEDVDGERFKLSDYKGKVVLLTFSGNWCGPCRAAYPRERAVVEKFRNRPFVLLSVNTDEERTTLKKSIDSGEITWRCWWDGGVGGPITTRWSPQVFPTSYVIDHEGIIRRRNPREEEVETLVESLVGIIEHSHTGEQKQRDAEPAPKSKDESLKGRP
ncbi:TlpA family protein disulfide reductase [Planctomyces sp. SH-PL62]|uniref:TlpA family protein disulfide reductase n=1 Tax=Planctomyces sp. SH-PL62 TaxID=1636152 RepID=UPI00078B7A83|nr:TlpA disulfide reductase family protein [Planctomyces sp. SH-PL62]AMV40946.1 Thiol-disulfide oxidoreductase ResA [Planctomyces sp. SH-PL62]